MSETAAKIICGSCRRSYSWKPELVGKRVKCKCGQAITVAELPKAEVNPAEADDDLYGFAEEIEKPVRKLPTLAAPVMEPAVEGAPVTLGYQRVSPQEKERSNALSGVYIDKKRDLQVPFILLTIGAILYLAFYAFQYHMGVAGLAISSIGLLLMTIFETALLVGFALIVAGPLGVSFGNPGTAVLKFASIALFCDGISAWVDGLVQHLLGAGGGGIFGFGAIGLPVAAGIYWVTMIYLFDMDSGDSWLVVIILSVFYRIVRMALVLLLLSLVLNLGGVAGSKVPSFATPSASGDPVAMEVDDAKAHQTLKEARQYVKDRQRGAESETVNGWYDAGCPNVWFEVTRDINGKGQAWCLIAELPDDKTARAKCIDIAKAYVVKYKLGDGSTFVDTGQPYLKMPIR